MSLSYGDLEDIFENLKNEFPVGVVPHNVGIEEHEDNNTNQMNEWLCVVFKKVSDDVEIDEGELESIVAKHAQGIKFYIEPVF